MNFVAEMLFTQQVFHLKLKCLLLFQIKSQPGVAYKSVDYKKALLFFSLLKMIKFTTWVYFCFSLGQYCWKSPAKSRGFAKNIKRWDGYIGGLSIKGGWFKPAHWHWEAERGDLWPLNYWGKQNWRGDMRTLFIPWSISCA